MNTRLLFIILLKPPPIIVLSFFFVIFVTFFSVETENENFHGFRPEGWWLVKPRDRDSSRSQAKLKVI